MIPQELRASDQWLCSRREDKAPISPKTGLLADVRNRELYVSYEQATSYASRFEMDVGFVLTHDDPFTVIDLDKAETEEQRERQYKIYEAFPTYAEFSRSGNGIHIWCKGTLPRGARRDFVEVYPFDRYMITTGNSTRDVPITDCQEMLDVLFAEISRNGAGLAELVDVEERLSDAEVYDMAINAVNWEKFDMLCRGEWQGTYPSQSEADFALMDMLCFYTHSNDQAKRLFRMSALGKRDKAQREEYLDRMVKKIRAEEVPDVDFSHLKLAVPPTPTGNGVGITPHVEKKPLPSVAKGADFTLPPGFVGEMAQYIFESSNRPVMEVAVAAALGLAAGVCGRQFNISGTGLNQYIILLAKTGVGKEDGPNGVGRICAAARATVPVVDNFLGPGTFASGQAIIRHLDQQPAFVSLLGEFGLTLRTLSDENANALAIIMRRVLLDLYTKSGRTSVLYSSAYSDKEKNTKTLFAPALTLLGESTPDNFYEGLSHHHISDGLIPRFLIIEYPGDRVKRNRNAFAPPSDTLVKRFADLVEVCLRMQANNSWETVALSEPAQKLMDAFDSECDAHIRDGGNDAIRQLWNRAHLKALRLAALLATADRPHTPIMSDEEARWAIAVVKADVERLMERFEAGDFGTGESKKIADMRRVLREYVTKRNPPKHKMVTPEMHRDGVVPLSYLASRLYSLSSYKNSRLGPNAAIKEVIQHLTDEDTLLKVPPKKAAEHYHTNAALFKVVNP